MSVGRPTSNYLHETGSKYRQSTPQWHRGNRISGDSIVVVCFVCFRAYFRNAETEHVTLWVPRMDQSWSTHRMWRIPFFRSSKWMREAVGRLRHRTAGGTEAQAALARHAEGLWGLQDLRVSRRIIWHGWCHPASSHNHHHHYHQHHHHHHHNHHHHHHHHHHHRHHHHHHHHHHHRFRNDHLNRHYHHCVPCHQGGSELWVMMINQRSNWPKSVAVAWWRCAFHLF